MVKVNNEILVKTNLKFITWSLHRQFLLTMPTRELQPGGGEIYHLSETMTLTQIRKELFQTLYTFVRLGFGEKCQKYTFHDSDF